MNRLDDVLVLLGVLLIGVAVFLGGGWPWLCGYVGGLLLAAGLVVAAMQGRSKVMR